MPGQFFILSGKRFSGFAPAHGLSDFIGIPGPGGGGAVAVLIRFPVRIVPDLFRLLRSCFVLIFRSVCFGLYAVEGFRVRCLIILTDLFPFGHDALQIQLTCTGTFFLFLFLGGDDIAVIAILLADRSVVLQSLLQTFFGNDALVQRGYPDILIGNGRRCGRFRGCPGLCGRRHDFPVGSAFRVLFGERFQRLFDGRCPNCVVIQDFTDLRFGHRTGLDIRGAAGCRQIRQLAERDIFVQTAACGPVGTGTGTGMLGPFGRYIFCDRRSGDFLTGLSFRPDHLAVFPETESRAAAVPAAAVSAAADRNGVIGYLIRLLFRLDPDRRPVCLLLEPGQVRYDIGRAAGFLAGVRVIGDIDAAAAQSGGIRGCIIGYGRRRRFRPCRCFRFRRLC